MAETLAARGVPFVLVTGYDAGSLDRPLAETPLLSKPVDRGALGRTLAGLARPQG